MTATSLILSMGEAVVDLLKGAQVKCEIFYLLDFRDTIDRRLCGRNMNFFLHILVSFRGAPVLYVYAQLIFGQIFLSYL